MGPRGQPGYGGNEGPALRPAGEHHQETLQILDVAGNTAVRIAYGLYDSDVGAGLTNSYAAVRNGELARTMSMLCQCPCPSKGAVKHRRPVTDAGLPGRGRALAQEPPVRWYRSDERGGIVGGLLAGSKNRGRPNLWRVQKSA